jgi:serpin B
MSVYVNLGMTYAGARGETEKQLAEALHTELGQERFHAAFDLWRNRVNDALRKSRVTLVVAKALAIQTGYPVEEDFVTLARKRYGSEVAFLDFRGAPARATAQINQWVAKHTQGRIKELLGPGSVTGDTRLMLINAIYFKADWHSKFPKQATAPRRFWLGKASVAAVPTMYQQEQFSYGESDKVQVLELPYTGKAVSMILVLPGAIDGLAALEKNLAADDILKWVSLLKPAEEHLVEVYLPKFVMEMNMEIKAVLEQMGVKDLFSLEANLSALSSERPLGVNAFLHRAGIVVDEEGTVAWAATAAGFAELGSGPEPIRKVFRADHPFLFFIRENATGTVLFMGRVMHPGK